MQFVSTLSKKTKFHEKLVRHCCRFATKSKVASTSLLVWMGFCFLHSCSVSLMSIQLLDRAMQPNFRLGALRRQRRRLLMLKLFCGDKGISLTGGCCRKSQISQKFLGKSYAYIIRSTHPSRPNTVGLKCPSARPYVRPYVRPSFRPQKVTSISMTFACV